MLSKLNLEKETLARLQDNQLSSIEGGDGVITSRMDPQPEGPEVNGSCCVKTCRNPDDTIDG